MLMIKKSLRSRSETVWVIVILLMPALILMFLFKILPILAALIASTGNYDTTGQRISNAGLDNFQLIIAEPEFWHSLYLTILFGLIKVPLQLIIGLGTALLFRNQTLISRMARSLLIVPSFVGMPVVALLFAYLFDLNIGLVNTLLNAIGVERIGWLTTPGWSQLVMVTLSIWRDAGVTMLIFLAGLTHQPTDLIESARVEGAGVLQIFRYITLPLLQRSIQFAVVLVTLFSFQIVVPVWVMTKGGPDDATNVISYRIYEQTFQFFDWGVSSAMAFVVLLIVAIIIGLEMLWLRPKWQY